MGIYGECLNDHGWHWQAMTTLFENSVVSKYGNSQAPESPMLKPITERRCSST